MQYKYEYAVFIGRFQPFHEGHLHVIEKALEQANKVIVLVGSATGARRPRNPWSYQERHGVIMDAINKGMFYSGRVWVLPLRDYIYREDRWLDAVQRAVGSVAPSTTSIALIGRNKDESTYYLSRFPQWKSIEVSDGTNIDATMIRGAFFSGKGVEGNFIPAATIKFLHAYSETPECARMAAEWKIIHEYQLEHDNGQYHRNNVTADAVVLQAGHVLMVRRGAMPGKGMLALPGGHVNRKEKPIDASIRELVEETRIKVPESVLRGSVVETRWFDDPHRSDLCRTYTHATFIRLTNEGAKLAKVRGGDDAAQALWIPLSQLREEECFDDHWHIVDAFIGLK